MISPLEVILQGSGSTPFVPPHTKGLILSSLLGRCPSTLSSSPCVTTVLRPRWKIQQTVVMYHPGEVALSLLPVNDLHLPYQQFLPPAWTDWYPWTLTDFLLYCDLLNAFKMSASALGCCLKPTAYLFPPPRLNELCITACKLLTLSLVLCCFLFEVLYKESCVTAAGFAGLGELVQDVHCPCVDFKLWHNLLTKHGAEPAVHLRMPQQAGTYKHRAAKAVNRICSRNRKIPS